MGEFRFLFLFKKEWQCWRVTGTIHIIRCAMSSVIFDEKNDPMFIVLLMAIKSNEILLEFRSGEIGDGI